jgi:hypothetical protein
MYRIRCRMSRQDRMTFRGDVINNGIQYCSAYRLGMYDITSKFRHGPVQFDCFGKLILRDKYVTDCVIGSVSTRPPLGRKSNIHLLSSVLCSPSATILQQWAVTINVQFARQLLLVHSM